MTEFNPFSKLCKNIRSRDLQLLITNEVAEGWFVEYKAEPVSPGKTARSVASFANSDGGWYIVGVNANTDNAAKEVQGFSLNDHKNPKERFRDIIKSNVDPVPYFESKLISVGEGKVVLVVHIPRGDESPYLTLDGRIYRRINEGSDPIVEKDRYSIQKLFERSQERKDFVKRFCQHSYSMSVGQSEELQSFLEIYFLTRPLNTFEIVDFREKDKFKTILKTFATPTKFMSSGMTAHIKFNNIYSSSNSYTIRCIEDPNHTLMLVATIELFWNGNAKKHYRYL